jgi:hypothetical protein
MVKYVGVFTGGLVLLTSLWRITTMKRLFCGLAVLALLLQAIGQVRSDFIYWNDFNDGHIRRANLDGSGQEILVSGLTTPGFGFGPYGRQDVLGRSRSWRYSRGQPRRFRADDPR